jgi:hypothetical protein
MRALVMVVAVGYATSAYAAPAKVDIEDGADHQIAAQGTYKGGLANSWEWQFGTKRSGTNITGIVASGMIAAYRVTGLKAHEKGALKAAKSLIKAYDGGWRNKRPHTQDIEFLVAAGYVIDAAKWFHVLEQRFGSTGYVDYVLGARQRGKSASLLGWDIASAMRAAMAVGKINVAREMLQRLIQQRRAWDGNKDSAQATTLSAASLLWALGQYRSWRQLDSNEARFAASMLRRVIAKQSANGAYRCEGDTSFCTQATAYAAIGLNYWKSGKRASKRARRWLQSVGKRDRQFFEGGRIWASYYSASGKPGKRYHSEIQAEVMMALAVR